MSFETVETRVAHERMSPVFEKYHLNPEGGAPWPFRPVMHHFTGPDHGDPHDHPWSFTSHVLSGGYTEEVFRVNSDGRWESEIFHRVPGSSHWVPAIGIHRIVELPAGECWTLVMAGAPERETRFWRFAGERAVSRAWHEREFA